MDYERGLDQMKKYAKGTDWLYDAFTFEARLIENLESERRFGTNPQIRSDRAKILDGLNRLCKKKLGVSFNDLC